MPAASTAACSSAARCSDGCRRLSTDLTPSALSFAKASRRGWAPGAELRADLQELRDRRQLGLSWGLKQDRRTSSKVIIGEIIRLERRVRSGWVSDSYRPAWLSPPSTPSPDPLSSPAAPEDSWRRARRAPGRAARRRT